MEMHTPPFDETQIFNGMLLKRVRAIPGYVVFSEHVYDTFADYDPNHCLADHGIIWDENGNHVDISNFADDHAPASDDSAFPDDEY